MIKASDERQQMKRDNWNQIKFYLLSGMILLCVFVAAAYLGVREAEVEYLKEMQIISLMLEAPGIDTAVEILKDQNKELMEMGRERLVDYGYSVDGDNALYQDFRQRCDTWVRLSAAGFLVSLAGVWILYFREKKGRMKDADNLCDVIGHYRKESFQVQDQLLEVRESVELEKLGWAMGDLGDYLKLLQARVKVEREEMKTLVTDISHQLKTPVAALKTSFEILNREGLTPEEQQEFVNRCFIQLQGVEELLAALINISRMESGMIEIRQEDVRIFETLHDAVNRVYIRAGEKGISIELEDGEQLEEMVLPHDRKWLGEAFINILENAVKYSPSDTGIVIRVMERTSFLRIEIEDQGMGIPKNEYHKIFQRFYRGNSAMECGEPGSGVGLYLSREIIGMHGGMISVTAAKHRTGSIFVIHLPYKATA